MYVKKITGRQLSDWSINVFHFIWSGNLFRSALCNSAAHFNKHYEHLQSTLNSQKISVIEHILRYTDTTIKINNVFCIQQENCNCTHTRNICLLLGYCLLYYLQVYKAHNLDLMLLRWRSDGLVLHPISSNLYPKFNLYGYCTLYKSTILFAPQLFQQRASLTVPFCILYTFYTSLNAAI